MPAQRAPAREPTVLVRKPSARTGFGWTDAARKNSTPRDFNPNQHNNTGGHVRQISLASRQVSGGGGGGIQIQPRNSSAGAAAPPLRFAPSRPARPLSPIKQQPPPPHQPRPISHRSTDSVASSSVHALTHDDQLRLDVQFNPPSQTTYANSVYAPSLILSSPHLEELEKFPVQTATRVSRGGSGQSGQSGRKQSVATIVFQKGRTGSDSSTLAMRTSHLSGLPGYEWRLQLLEKLEILLGTSLSVYESEEILHIGKGVSGEANTRANSRKSLINMPPSSPRPGHAAKKESGSGTGFFGSVLKRAFASAETALGGSSPAVETISPAFPPLRMKPGKPASKAIFGAPLGAVAAYGFVTSMIAGQRHDLPSICFNTVEETYRRAQGAKITGVLFLNAGNPTQVGRLVEVFSTAPDYGEGYDLSLESIFDVTSLLKKYLTELPEPLLDSRLWRLFLSACVDSKAPARRRVACAQILLRLLPTPNFSLLVYLIAFLSQVPLFPHNALPLESVAVIFGPKLLSPRALAPGAKLNQKLVPGSIGSPSEPADAMAVTSKRAQDGLLWLLVSWDDVADGLLDLDFKVDTDAVLGKAATTVNSSFSQLPTPEAPPEEQRRRSYKKEAVLSNYRKDSATSTYGDEGSPSLPSPDLSVDFDFASGWGIADPDRPTSHYPPTLSPGDTTEHVAPSQSRLVANAHHRLSALSHSEPPPNDYSPSPTSFGHSDSRRRSLSETPQAYHRPSSMEQRPQPPALTDAEARNIARGYPRAESSTMGEQRTSESSRGSASTTESSLPEPVARASAKPRVSLNGFARPRPEDEYGPLGPSSMSLLDDLLEAGEEPFRYDTPDLNKTTPPTELFSAPADLFARSASSELRESQQLQETQRREIQTLWKQLEDHEAARAQDKVETDRLREELVQLKSSGISGTGDTARMARLEQRCLEAEHSARMTEQSFKASLEVKENESRVARQELAKVASQLSAIRVVLGGRFEAFQR
ncbi:hypothetical protein RQP46_001075 [Phenoliferia psychrophenolica]